MSKNKKYGIDKHFSDSVIYMNHMFNHYYMQLSEIGMSCFKWINLPDSVDEIFLERVLFNMGQAIFFKDDGGLGFLTLKCTNNGSWNVYDIPKYRTAYASNNYNRNLTEKNSVIIYNNYMRQNCAYSIRMYAYDLAQTKMTMRINMNTKKTPILIICSESQKMTMQNLFMQYDGNAPIIYGSKDIDMTGVQVLDLKSEFIAKDCYDIFQNTFNEALTYLGIPTVNVVKRERMNESEVNQNLGANAGSLFSRINTRKKACKMINEMFGLNIDVMYQNSEYQNLYEQNYMSSSKGDITEDE